MNKTPTPNPMDILLQIQASLQQITSELAEAKSTISELKEAKAAEATPKVKPTAAEHLSRIGQERMKANKLKEEGALNEQTNINKTTK